MPKKRRSKKPRRDVRAEPSSRPHPPAKSDDGPSPRRSGFGRAGGKKASEKEADKKGTKRPKSAARGLVETIMIVAVLVLVIRGLLVEAFKIPSSSMEPTLIGHPYHGDRVLAWKPAAKWSGLERWSIDVFVKHPDEYEMRGGETSDRNFIKRLIGLPGERVLIAGGDIFIQEAGAADAEIARKPRGVQEGVWHEAYGGTDFGRSWEIGQGFSVDVLNTSNGGGDKTLHGDAEGIVWARLRRNRYDDDNGLITNLYVKRLRLRVTCPGEDCRHEFKGSVRTSRTRFACPECGREIDILRDDVVEGRPPWYPPTRGQEVAVGDLRVSFHVTPEAARGFALAGLSRDNERYLARVPLGGGEARVEGSHGVDARARVPPFTLGAARRISFAHVDQTLVLAVDGREIIRLEYDLSWVERAGTPRTNTVRIGLEDAAAVLAHPLIERDIHYLSRGGRSIVEFYSAGRGRGRGRWLTHPTRDLPGMQGYAGSAPAVRTRKKLGEDEYFFMGDNSPSSYDGRMWGPVAARDVVGRAFFAFWPPHQMGWLH